MRLGKKVRQFWHRREWEADLAEEVRIHRQMAADAAGSGTPAGAFGSEAYFLEESRAVWGFRWLESLGQDIQYALRGFRKAPLFALTVVGTIGLALGLNTTSFTVFDTYALRTIAVRDPHNLYGVWWTAKEFHPRMNWRAYQDLLKQDGAFSDVAASEYLFTPLDGRFGIGQLVSGNYFRMLQPGAATGRLIEPDDAGDTLVLSYSAWKNWYGADPEVLGRKVLLHGQPFEIVGVARPGFNGLREVPLDFWVPLTAYSRVVEGPDVFGPKEPEVLEVLTRLKPGVSEVAAEAALWAWAKAETAGLPMEKRADGVRLVSRATAVALTPGVVAMFSPVFVAFGLVLAVACANVSNMMLARALSRQREIGIRMSLGAGRARLVRQLLTESLMLAVPAAVAGFFVSQATIRGAQWLLFTTLPPAFSKIVRVPRLDPDLRVFGFVLAASFAATLFFGLIPAIQSTRSEYRPSRLRNALVAGQAMVCCLLLIYAVVMLRSVQQTTSLDVGIRTRGILDVRMDSKYLKAAAERLAAQPGVQGVAAAWQAPLYDPLRKIAVMPAGGRNEFPAGYNFVSPEYFPVLGIPILRGRAFTAEEARAGAAVAVVSQATAKLFWPGRDSLGETIQIAPPRPGGILQRRPAFTSVRVIGIARDAVSGFVGDGIDTTCLYFPTLAQSDASLLVAARGGKDAGRRLVEDTMNGIAPGSAEQVNPLDEVLATMQYPFRVAFWIESFLAGLALVLTVSGVYGVMSYAVSQRSKEIGIRIALGAGSGAVVRMVVAQSMRMAGIGAALGGAAALMLAPLFANRMQAVRPYDPVAYVLGLALVIGASLAASALPGRRAVRIDPVITLRCD